MATDTLKLVRWTAPHWEAARPVLLANLTSPGVRFIADGQSPQFVPGEHETGNIRLDAPYAGEVSTLDRHGNARFTVMLRSIAADPVADMNALVGQILMAPARSAIEWRRDGTGVPSYFPLRSDSSWTPAYGMRERQQGAGMTVALSVEVAPYVHHGSMDLVEDFAVAADYTPAANVVGGVLKEQPIPASWYTLRGFEYADVQVTVKGTPKAGSVNYALAPAIKQRSTDNRYFWATNEGAVLVLYYFNGATNASLASAAITLPVINTAYWCRIRSEGSTLTAEWWTTEPTPIAAPAATASFTMTGGTTPTAADMGAARVGRASPRGWGMNPGGQSDVTEFRVAPYTYRNQTLPQVLTLGVSIPGDLPALCDIAVTASGGAVAPVYGAFGWTARPTVPGFGVAPFGILEAEAGSIAAGFSLATGADRRGGSALTATAVGVVSWQVDASTIPPDADGFLSIDVYARISAFATASNFAIVLRADPRSGATFGATRYGDLGPGGLVGIYGSGYWMWRRLGRIRLSGQQTLSIVSSANAGGFLIDYLALFPTRSFVASPGAVPLDASYPKFIPSTSATTRTLLSDGGATINPPLEMPLLEHGLGRRIEMGPGPVDLIAKLSSVVADRPEQDTTEEALSHTATVHVRCLPRFAFA